jgi:hypothetical protein
MEDIRTVVRTSTVLFEAMELTTANVLDGDVEKFVGRRLVGTFSVNGVPTKITVRTLEGLADAIVGECYLLREKLDPGNVWPIHTDKFHRDYEDAVFSRMPSYTSRVGEPKLGGCEQTPECVGV